MQVFYQFYQLNAQFQWIFLWYGRAFFSLQYGIETFAKPNFNDELAVPAYNQVEGIDSGEISPVLELRKACESLRTDQLGNINLCCIGINFHYFGN